MQKETYFAEDLTLVLVLKGTIILEDEGKKQPLEAKSLYCINLKHFVTFFPETEENILLFLSIDSLFFASQFLPFFNTTFSIPVQPSQTNTVELANGLIELSINEFNDNEEQMIYRLMKLEAIILLLIQKFQEEVRHPAILSQDFQLRDILAYIDQNYSTGIKVKDIAEHFFLSESALSKVFKRETGEQLSKYLKKIKIHKSLSELLYTKKSIEQVALDFGFNSAKVYREQFKSLFSITPASYRHAHYGKKQTSIIQDRSLLNELGPKEILRILYSLSQKDRIEKLPTHLKHRNKRLVLEKSEIITKKNESELLIQIGSLKDLANEKVRNELLLLKKTGSLSCINCLRLFSETSISYYLARKTNLNSFPEFEELDSALQFVSEHHLHIMLTLSEKRYNCLSKDIYEHFFQHIYRKFGYSLLSSFRINFEFTPAFTPSELELYRTVYKKAKLISPAIQLGIKLPLPDPFEEKRIYAELRLLQPLLTEQCDFLSFTAEPNFVFKKAMTKMIDLSTYHQYVYTKTRFLLKALSEEKLSLPLYLLEWNTLTGTTISYNGLFFRGALIVADMLRLDKLIAGYGFWLNIEEHELELNQGENSSAGLDLFHFQSKKRPAYFCLELVKRVRGTVISEGEFYLFVKNQEKYQLLLWNTNYFDPHLSSEEAFIESQALDISISIKEILDGHYQVKQLTLDRHHGAVFYVYSQFQEAKHLDYETEAYIQAKTQMDLQVYDMDIQQSFTHFLTLDTNAVTLLEFTPL